MAESSIPCSSQQAMHARLEEIVQRHLAHPWRQPLRGFSHGVFTRVAKRAASHQSLILDSGCGTGVSTRWLATAFPDSLVIGIDRSEKRLARAPDLPPNACLVRAELADFWRLAKSAGWSLHRHYLLYPNPWPKPAHIKHRWHAHPVWPDLLALGGLLELRTNFRIYAEEFAFALELSGYLADMQVLSLPIEQSVSPFEAKYARSRHALFRVSARLR